MTNHTTEELLAILDQPTDVGTNGNRIESERRYAAMTLGTVKDPAVVPPLLERLKAETPGCGVHETLTWATVQHIDTALPDVLAMLTDADPQLRRTGAHILSKVGDPEHLDQLTPLVADADFDVALKAYRAVAVPALVKALADTDAEVREHAADALGHLGEEAAPAVDALADLAADPEASVRLSAVAALGQLGETAQPALQRLTGSSDPTVAAVARRFVA